jgi:hypothetical protein
LSEQLLPHRHQQQRQFRGDDREQMMTARRAAEALFTPKLELDVQPVPDPAQSIKAHKPRVLPILPPTPIRQETVNASATSEPRHALGALLKTGLVHIKSQPGKNPIITVIEIGDHSPALTVIDGKA